MVSRTLWALEYLKFYEIGTVQNQTPTVRIVWVWYVRTVKSEVDFCFFVSYQQR